MRIAAAWKEMVAGDKRPAYNAYVGRCVKREGRYVVIMTQTSFFVHEGGEKQGYSSDRGWVVELQARPATVAEMAALGATKEGRET